MKTHGKYILENKEPIPCEDLIVWAKWMGNNKPELRVAETFVRGYRVSTIFLGVDHNWTGGDPILFETMIFGAGSLDQEQIRSCTYNGAERIHEKTIEGIIEHRPYWLPVWMWKIIERIQGHE